MTLIAEKNLEGLAGRLSADEFVQVDGGEMLALLGPGASAQWAAFARSWDDLGLDRFMADGGRYRRRRHAAFRIAEGRVVRKPPQPHYQSRDYNALNGGVERWFDQIEASTEATPVLQAVFSLCARLFGEVETRAAPDGWEVEVHQFRIEAMNGAEGRPTPEGLHRDGVDWVLVMLVDRCNVAEGETEIGGLDGTRLGRFVLANPGDAVFLDDRRIFHGVTPIRPIDPASPSYRDALVVTFSLR